MMNSFRLVTSLIRSTKICGEQSLRLAVTDKESKSSSILSPVLETSV